MIPCYASQTRDREANQIIGDWVSQQIWGKPGCIVDYCSMGVFHKAELVAATLYHNWYPDTGVVELTSASTDKRWLTRPVLRAMFTMVFDMIGAQLAVLRVSELNTDMVAIAHRFGFDGVLIPRLRGRDEAEWIFTLTDNAWRSSRWNVDTQQKSS